MNITTISDATKALRDYERELTVKERAAIADILDDYGEGLAETSGDLVTALTRLDECREQLRLCNIDQSNAEVRAAGYDALVSAARKVTCRRCDDEGEDFDDGVWGPCPGCADLRTLLR